MSCDKSWLPDLLVKPDDPTKHKEYYMRVYQEYRKDFIESEPICFGKPVKPPCQSFSIHEGTCLHLCTREINRGGIKIRLFDDQRCARIKWIRAIIEAIGKQDLKLWRMKEKQGKWRRKIALTDFSYLVSIEEKAIKFILITGMVVDQPHEMRKLIKQYNKFKISP